MINYKGKEVELLTTVDCCIIGGGTAGVVAAISAKLSGVNVAIVEKSIFLGGTSTIGFVMPFMNSFVANPNGLNVALNKEYVNYDKNAHFNFNKPEILAMNNMTYAMFYAQKCHDLGIEVYYDSTFIDTIMENDKIAYAIIYAHNKMYAIKAKTFVDTSAEGVLAESAGCSLIRGDENNNNKHQATSLRYEMGGVDKVKLVSWLKEIGYVGFGIPQDPNKIEFIRDKSYENLINEAISKNEVTVNDMRYIQAFAVPGKPNTFAFNGPQLTDSYSLDDPMKMRVSVDESLASIYRYSNFMIKYIPGFENAYVSSIASMMGVRESVRVKTKYILENKDYLNRARFEDGIAKGDWYIDVHADDQDSVETCKYEHGEYYEIPYRSLITNEVSNLIVGGRIIGASFRVEASVRIQVTVRDISEVIGKAIAYSVKNNIDLNKIDGSLFKVNY